MIIISYLKPYNYLLRMIIIIYLKPYNYLLRVIINKSYSASLNQISALNNPSGVRYTVKPKLKSLGLLVVL